MVKYTLWQTATVRQFKEVEMLEEASDNDVIDEAWDIPWQTAKTIDCDGIEVEKDD